MRRPLLVLLASLALTGCGRGSSAGSLGGATVSTGVTRPGAESRGGRLSILTYNVQGVPRGTGTLSSLSSVSLSSLTAISSPAPSLEQIGAKLSAYDLVLLQEDFWFHDAAVRGATHPYRTERQRRYGGLTNDGLNRLSILPGAGFTRTPWRVRHGLNDSVSGKGFSFARHGLAPGVTVDVYNLHADAGRDAADTQARAAQFAQLLDVVRAVSAGRAVVVAGDTNLEANDPRDMQVLRDLLTGAGLTDSARSLGKPETLDRVMFRGGAGVQLQAESWQVASEFVDAAGSPLSDHAAIHVELRWRRILP